MRPSPTIHRIPGVDAPVAVERVSTDDQIRVTLVADVLIARGTPIIRGDGPPYVLRNGRRVVDQAEQRDGFRAVLGPGGHLERFAADHPGRSVVAVTGCGNLGLNASVRAWIDGRVLGIHGPEGGAIAVSDDGRGRRVEPGTHGDDGWALSGPDLVRDGEPCISDVVTFADPRHRLLFAYVPTETGIRIDFGHDRLLASSALYADAAAGRPVTFSLADRHVVRADDLRRALAVKGYREGDPREARGRYRLIDDDQRVELSFLDGIYPHHALVVDGDDRVHSVLVSGLSNRAGTTIPALAEGLASAGARDAILLDNGGDVGLWDAVSETWTIRPAEPDREAAWPLSACLVWHRPSAD